MGAVTDPARKRRQDPGNPEVCGIFYLHKVYSDAGHRRLGGPELPHGRDRLRRLQEEAARAPRSRTRSGSGRSARRCWPGPETTTGIVRLGTARRAARGRSGPWSRSAQAMQLDQNLRGIEPSHARGAATPASRGPHARRDVRGGARRDGASACSLAAGPAGRAALRGAARPPPSPREGAPGRPLRHPHRHHHRELPGHAEGPAGAGHRRGRASSCTWRRSSCS